MTKPVLSQISTQSLLQAIACIQPPVGTQHPEPVLRLLKEAVQKQYQQELVTWTSITRTRTEAITEGLVLMNGYAHTLTSAGKEKLVSFKEVVAA